MNLIKRLSCGMMITLITTLYSSLVYAAKVTTIKIALLDNFTLEKYAQIYKDSYYAGIETAILAAKKNHILIHFKNFTYDNNPLGIFDAVPAVKAWHPDVVIGPHYSNQFLLLKNHFNHVLVLSPYATDEAISRMPPNFYSLALPDKYMAKANYIFIKKHFPNRNVYNISQLDCKDCIDTTKNLDAIYAEKGKLTIANNAVYLGDQVNTTNISKLMRDYQKNSVIVLQPLNDLDANILIARIATFLKRNNLVFIYNVDNWGNSKNFQTIVDKSDVRADMFRITPWIINPQSRSYQLFVKYYRKKFHASQNNAVSYMSYRTVMSVVEALQKFPINPTLNMRESVLASYLAALKKDKNWFRVTDYAIYQHTHSHDVLLGKISIHANS